MKLSSLPLAAFTAVSIATQVYVTSDIYAKLAKSQGATDEHAATFVEMSTRLTNVEWTANRHREEQTTLVELARAVNNEVIGLRGVVMKRGCK